MDKTYSTFEAMEEINNDITKVFFDGGFGEIKERDMKIIIVYNGFICNLCDCGIQSSWFNSEWTLKPVLVNWETALKHMVNGGSAVREQKTYNFDKGGKLDYVNSSLSVPQLSKDMLNDKWELIK